MLLIILKKHKVINLYFFRNIPLIIKKIILKSKAKLLF